MVIQGQKAAFTKSQRWECRAHSGNGERIRVQVHKWHARWGMGEGSPGESGGPAEKGPENRAKEFILHQQTGEGFMPRRAGVTSRCKKILQQPQSRGQT